MSSFWVTRFAALTSAAIQNIFCMSLEYRSLVLENLSGIQVSTAAASLSPDDMAAYLSRLVKHLLDNVSSHEQQCGSDGFRDQTGVVRSTAAIILDPAGLAPEWAISSTSQVLHEELWRHLPSAPSSSTAPPVESGSQVASEEPLNPFSETLFPSGDDELW
jgi:hypothetical protein